MAFGTVAASALTLYRYVDVAGQVVVVDSMDKIPIDIRKSVRIETIGKAQPSQSGLAQEPSGRIVVPAAETTGSEGSPNRSGQLYSDDGTGMPGAAGASQPERLDPAHASATLWLSGMQGIHHRNEEIWYVANSLSPFHKRILVLQEENLRMLDHLRGLEEMNWKDHQDWIDKARGLTDQLRQLAFSISLWLRQDPLRLRQELPPLINRIRMVLDMTASALPAASPGK